LFDLSITKLLVLAVLALVIFGPNELPKVAAQAGKALRDLRRIAEGAKADLKEGLGPEFQDFDFEDLNPRRFVQKHLLEEPVNGTYGAASAPPSNGTAGTASAAANGATVPNGKAAPFATDTLPKDEPPPFDFDAT